VSDHAFCQSLLRLAREEAKEKAVSIPKRITALRADRHQFFIEADGMKGEYVSGDCAYEAKAKFIHLLIDRTAAK
jgi:hypothetical protein